MFYTVGTAAKATGKSKPTITRAINKGQISAIRQEDGSYRIDPAELHRVFQPVTHDGNANGDKTHGETPSNNGLLQGTVEVLRELVRQIEGERDDLRRRLDNSETAREREAEAREQAAAEVRRLTLVITHQQQQKAEPEPEAQPAPAPEPQPMANQNHRRPFGAAFKGWALAGFVALLVIAAALAASSLGLLWKLPG
jgi:excisionase family DNA binding protein